MFPSSREKASLTWKGALIRNLVKSVTLRCVVACMTTNIALDQDCHRLDNLKLFPTTCKRIVYPRVPRMYHKLYALSSQIRKVPKSLNKAHYLFIFCFQRLMT